MKNPLKVYFLPKMHSAEEDLTTSLILEALEVVDQRFAVEILMSVHMEKKSLYESIEESDVVICQIENLRYNSIYEVGLAHGLNKPVIVLIDTSIQIPTDQPEFRYIAYDKTLLQEKKYRNLVIQVIINSLVIIKNTPDQWQIKKNDEKSPLKSIFISYSHKDTQYLERLNVHLKPLQRKGLIKVWSDQQLQLGDKFTSIIQTELENAAIAILLVSADFLASDFIINNELPPLLKAAENKGTKIIPVIVKPCRFQREESISQFQASNDPINPLCKLQEWEQESVFEKVSQMIEFFLSSD